MDTRQKQTIEDVVKSKKATIKKIDDNSYLIPTNKFEVDNAYKEAVIYNLVKKLDSLDAMNKRYAEELEKVETFPSWMKYYLHVPCKSFQLSIFKLKHRPYPWCCSGYGIS